jgi:hypothetical protein
VVLVSQKLLEKLFLSKLNQSEGYFIKNNNVGNLNGLFANYIVGSQPDITWTVEVNEDWVNLHPEVFQGSYLALSVLGYSLFNSNNNLRQ